MDIAVWLRGLGLKQYEAAFRANAIDASVLPRLTAEDLKDLGVTLVGHRRVIYLSANHRGRRILRRGLSQRKLLRGIVLR